MNTIQRYVLREILGPTCLGLLVFTFVFLVGALFKVINELLNSGIPLSMALEILLLILPGAMAFTIPMSILVGVLLGIGRLAADREILAIRASGIRLTHLAVPILIFAALVSGLMIWANMRLIPYSNLKFADLGVQVMFRSLSAMPVGIPQDLKTKGEAGESQIFVDSKDPETGKLNGIAIVTRLAASPGRSDIKTSDVKNEAVKLLKDNKALKTSKANDKKNKQTSFDSVFDRTHDALILAEGGEFEPNVADRVVYIRLTSGSIHLTDPDERGGYDIINFDTLIKGVVPSFDRFKGGSINKNPVEMSVSELRNQVAVRDKGRRYSVELYQRFSVPLACLAFAMIAFPLAVYVRPTGKAIAFAISFLLILFYYGLLQYGVALGHEGSSFGPFAIFLPNIIIAGIGCFMLYRMVTK